MDVANVEKMREKEMPLWFVYPFAHVITKVFVSPLDCTSD